MQFFSPEHSIGLSNAWIGVLLLTLLGLLAVRVHPRGARLADASWFGEEELRWAKISTLFNLNTMLYAFFVPLQFENLLFLLGVTLFCLSLVATIWAYASFLNTPKEKPVLTGLYRISRNPIYTFTGLALLGVCLAATSWILLLLTLLSFLPIHKLVLAEERYCRRRFGADYEHYMSAVSRYGLG